MSQGKQTSKFFFVNKFKERKPTIDLNVYYPKYVTSSSNGIEISVEAMWVMSYFIYKLNKKYITNDQLQMIIFWNSYSIMIYINQHLWNILRGSDGLEINGVTKLEVYQELNEVIEYEYEDTVSNNITKMKKNIFQKYLLNI